MCAETLSLLVGLSLCEKLQLCKVAVRCDSKALIDIVNERARPPWHIQPLIRKISRYKYFVSEVSHCFREANVVVDSLAKEAQSHRQTKIYTSLPQVSKHVRALILMDSWSICNFRFTKSLVYSWIYRIIWFSTEKKKSVTGAPQTPNSIRFLLHMDAFKICNFRFRKSY